MYGQMTTARDIMTSSVYTVRPSVRVKRVSALICTHRIGGVPVVESKSHFVGLISERDILEAMYRRHPQESGQGFHTRDGRRQVPVHLTSPSGIPGSLGSPCPRSRDELPDRDDVPENVRRVAAPAPTFGGSPARSLGRHGAHQHGGKSLEQRYSKER